MIRLPAGVPAGLVAGASLLWISVGGHWAVVLGIVGLYLLGQAAWGEYGPEGRL